jgi:hypothetical protein
MRRSPRTPALLPLLSLLGAVSCAEPAPPTFPDKGPITQRSSGASERASVAITVYNGGFGVVREVRDVKLAQGRVALELRDVSAGIRPETVHIRPLGDRDSFRVLEQNFRYDLLGPEKLLEKYVGRKVRVYRWNEAKGQDEAKDAEVLAVDKGVVLRIDGEITFGYPGRIAFPEVPANLVSRPTLVWLLASRAPRERIEVSYMSTGLGWEADYVLVVSEDDTRGDLMGWVTLRNTSGASYEDATLKLVAGNVNRVMHELQGGGADRDGAMEEPPPEEPQFQEEGFFEYHLYTLGRPTTLLDKEQKQVSLLEGHDAALRKKLVLRGYEHFYRYGLGGGQPPKQKVGVYLELDNSEKNHLGIPLPRGVVRVYKADKSGAKQFIGEDRIDHTPRDEKITVKMGDSFDVVGERKQTDFAGFSACQSESAWEISLRNHKDKRERVEIEEPASGDWTILESSLPAKKKDAHTFTFDVEVPARGETKVTYKVRVRWC